MQIIANRAKRHISLMYLMRHQSKNQQQKQINEQKTIEEQIRFVP